VAAVSVSQFLMLYSWFVLAGVLVFLLLIARFYQRFSSEQTYFRLFILPIILFGMSTVRYASINQVAGDGLGDMLSILAGVSLVAQCIFLYHMMTRNR
jgi:hypothetical protein